MVWQKSSEILRWQYLKTAFEVKYLEGKDSGQVQAAVVHFDTQQVYWFN